MASLWCDSSLVWLVAGGAMPWHMTYDCMWHARGSEHRAQSAECRVQIVQMFAKWYRFENPKPYPLHGKPPIEVLVPDTSRGGRAGRAPLTPRRAPGAPKCARRPCDDTQEIAKSFWSYSYGSPRGPFFFGYSRGAPWRLWACLGMGTARPRARWIGAALPCALRAR
jgi:hypothetical protein